MDCLFNCGKLADTDRQARLTADYIFMKTSRHYMPMTTAGRQ